MVLWFKGIKITLSEVVFVLQSIFFVGYFHLLDFYWTIAVFEYLLLFYLFVVEERSLKRNLYVIISTPIVFYSCVHLLDSPFVIRHEVSTSVLLAILLAVRFFHVLDYDENRGVLSLPINLVMATLVLSRFYIYDSVTSELSWLLLGVVLSTLIVKHQKCNEKIHLYLFISILWALSLVSNSIILSFSFLPVVMIYLYIGKCDKTRMSPLTYGGYLVFLFYLGGQFWGAVKLLTTFSSGISYFIFVVWGLLLGWILLKIKISTDLFESISTDLKTDWWIVFGAICYLFLSVGSRLWL
jgi:hypothetical protein